MSKRLITNEELKDIAEKAYLCWQLNERVTWDLADVEKMASALCELCNVRGVTVVNKAIDFEGFDGEKE